MARHIHVHLHRTTDAGEFVEAKHPRSHGKFSKVAGAKGSAKPTAKAVTRPASAGPATKPSSSAPELHAKHEKVAQAIVNMVKRDPFLGNYASYPNEYGNPLIDRKNPDGSVEFSIRNMGQWVNPPEARNEEDYDWQVPTDKTQAAIKKLADNIEKQYGVKLEVGGSEKNYTDFTIKSK